MILIDGSMGEGGGQILRSALCLSLLTGRSFRLANIRACRTKPGLRPQHLASAHAAAAISGARVDGDRPGSMELTFVPGPVRSGRYRFDIGTAGAVSLLLQTIILPLTFAREESEVTVVGGTHVPWSPCFHYLANQYAPYLRQIGFEVQLEMDRAGFYPRGGGQVRARIGPNKDRLCPQVVLERGALKRITGLSAVANLPISIAQRQKKQMAMRLAARGMPVETEVISLPALSQGTAVVLSAEFVQSRSMFSALGARGKPAERVADEAVDELEKFLDAEGAVDAHLADQLLLPLAFAPGVSVISTPEITAHLTTNAEVIRMFMEVKIEIDGEQGGPGKVTIHAGAVQCQASGQNQGG